LPIRFADLYRDPAEGMGLAIAILEELTTKKCLFVTTTHYPEIKDYAKSVEGLINARMAFDRQNLMPLYKLEVGEAGESCALYIAKRLGLPQRMIDRASIAAYGNKSGENYKNISSFTTTSTTNLDNEYNSIPTQRIKKHETKKTSETPRSMKFNIGDSVIVYPQKTIGIVYKRANEKGEMGVQIKKQKLLINHKRLKLHVPASELYPEDYDFSIIFDTVANRKARHKMESRHNPNLVIETKSKE
jgi:dsDNA-specific endonuclease/ATPase MutS2